MTDRIDPDRIFPNIRPERLAHNDIAERLRVTDRPLITDEAVEAAANGMGPVGNPYRYDMTREILTAFLAHVEGERPCETCMGSGWVSSETGESIPVKALGMRSDAVECSTCEGTGLVRRPERTAVVPGAERDEWKARAERAEAALIEARAAIHDLCLERKSTDGYSATMRRISEALAAVQEADRA